MITANMHEAKSRLSELVNAVVDRGEIVILCRNGKPAARIVSADPSFVDHFREDPRLKATFIEDPTLPVPEEAWPDAFR